MRAFDPNEYRKRVLAAVEKRGGIEQSDAFELYDIPLDEASTVTDVEVSARIDEVWGFWQKQRDHPKYRVLVGLLVDGHGRLSMPLRTASSRRVEAHRVAQLRARREGERYEMIDTAIERLVNRHGGIPAGKIPGLEDIGKMSGLDAAEIAARVRRHRILDESVPAAPESEGLSAQRRGQIRQLLAEYERLLPGDAVPTLLALLGLDYAGAMQTGEIRLRAEALRARTRELPPGRIRVVLDELLVHVRDLLEPGGQGVEDYLKAIASDVTELLRPQVRAAVLVEDQLVEADYEFLVGEAIAAGLDHGTAQQVVYGLAVELGSTVEGVTQPPTGSAHTASNAGATHSASRHATGGGYSSPARGGSSHRGTGSSHSGTSHAGSSQSHSGATHAGSSHSSPARGHQTSSARAWEEPLKAARAALRAGRPLEASRHVEQARQYAGTDGLTSVRPVADEVGRILAEAAVRWRSATVGCAGKRYIEALDHLQYLERSASDVPNPQGGQGLAQLLAQVRAAIAEADRMLAAAPTEPVDARMRAMRAVLDLCADHTGAQAALAAVPLDPPATISATRKPDGTVTITWSPSQTAHVEYRVTRLQPDGSWRVVGRTRTTELEDGGAPPGPPPVYGVVATMSGRASEMSRTDAAPRTGEAGRGDQAARTHAAGPTGIGGPADTTGSGGGAGRIDMTRPLRGRAATSASATPTPAIPTSTAQAGSTGAAGYADVSGHSNAADRTGGVGRIDMTRPPRGHAAASASAPSPTSTPAPPLPATAAAPTSPTPHAPTTPTGSTDNPTPSGMPTVENLTAQGGLLIFDWPPGITEVMVVARSDSPPVAPDDPDARAWKVTNTRYQIDGGVRIPADISTPCHIAIASCRRAPSGTLTVAVGFAPTARIRWNG
ncbi:fibronectin type III domain-containing protein [Nocardia uniformis]|uniref:Fibronectin type III domain-containing protein n=1 Tax=Nocardia uniformis TaxID=53432 RepID=A0A849C8J9_9NOCA|nr:fibronectin type III domain-containing protein [Nocardia uniformis]NNH74994.1 fibronectin type III domain-containing protein [Nocardia uniformis]